MGSPEYCTILFNSAVMRHAHFFLIVAIIFSQFMGFLLDFTANVGTEDTVKIFLFWDVFKELLETQPVLHRFG
jgi:hypothetical protein